MWRGSLSLRRLGVLLQGLPGESLWWTAMRLEPGAKASGDMSRVRWSTTHDLLASVVDATNAVAHTVAQVNSSKPVKAPPPFPRPGTAKTRKRRISAKNLDRIRGWLGVVDRGD